MVLPGDENQDGGAVSISVTGIASEPLVTDVRSDHDVFSKGEDGARNALVLFSQVLANFVIPFFC
jgi:hypothetical protein